MAMGSFSRGSRWRALGACLTALAVSGCTAHVATISGREPAGSQPSGSVTFTLPLLPDPARHPSPVPFVAVSVGGGADKAVEIDTGSRGLVIARTALGPAAVDTGRAGHVEYTSSGRILSGEYFLAPIRFHTTHATVRTIPIRVLGVETSSCDPRYPRCHPEPDVTHVGVLGVGYGNYADTGEAPTSEVNPFLELETMRNSATRRGYIITRDHVTLGLTQADLASFRQIPLPRLPGSAGLPGDWGGAPGCFSLPDHSADTYCGTILFDTGLATMIVGLDQAQRPLPLRDAIPNGTRIRIGLPSLASPALSYTATTGDPDDPLAPQGNPAARWSTKTAPFVNTGRHLLAGYDYLFDADTGHIGFRPDPN